MKCINDTIIVMYESMFTTLWKVYVQSYKFTKNCVSVGVESICYLLTTKKLLQNRKTKGISFNQQASIYSKVNAMSII